MAQTQTTHDPRTSGNPFRDDVHEAETTGHTDQPHAPHELGAERDHASGGNDIGDIYDVGHHNAKGRPPLQKKGEFSHSDESGR